MKKEVICDLKGENQFLSKEIWETIMIDLQREIGKPVLKLVFAAYGIIESLSKFEAGPAPRILRGDSIRDRILSKRFL